MNHDDYIIAREELATEMMGTGDESREPTIGEVLDRMIETLEEKHEKANRILVAHDLQWKV